MEGAQGGRAWPVGGRLPVIVAEWLNGAVWPHWAHLCRSVKTVHVITTVKQWLFFPFLHTWVPPTHPDMLFSAALRIRQRAEFNLDKVMVISRWDYIDSLDIIYILKMGKPAGSIFC